MRVLVLGGTNFIGPPAVERLLEYGHDVTVFHRGESEGGELAAVPHIHGDRAHLDDFADELRSVAPEVVLDMAPMFERDALAATRAVRGVAKRFVAISSVDVYRAYGRLHGSEPGPVEPMPLAEDAPLREKLYPYRGERGGKMDDYDKILVERTVMSAPDVLGTVLRLPAVHGERDYQRRLFMEVARIDAKRPAMLVSASESTWRWSRAYAGNVADAIALVVTDGRAAGRVYNMVEPAAPTQLEWLREVGRIAGWRGEVVVIPNKLMPPHPAGVTNNYAQSIVVDSARIRAELGYAERVSWDDGIARAVAWERANPPERVNPKWIDYAAEDRALEALARSR
jgi:nucleoside-diphosphate-sugar epimerase